MTEFPAGPGGKESAYNAGDYPWVRKIYQRRAWLTTPVFLPEQIQVQRSLVGCSPWGCYEDLALFMWLIMHRLPG